MGKKWIEGFLPGKHIDTNGVVHVFTRQDCLELAESYNPQLHEAPIVAGHPAHDDPAMGWVDAMRFNEQLQRVEYAEKDLLPEFAEMLARKLYKKRSLALYTRDDLRNPTPGKLHLRHVGYLGAQVPAIKGLKDRPAFKEDDQSQGVTFEFCEADDMAVARLFRNLRDFIISKFSKEDADQILPDYEVTGLQVSACCMPEEEPHNMGLTGPTYKEAEMDQKQFDALAKRVEGLEAGVKSITDNITAFGETIKGLTTTITSVQTTFAEGELSAARRDFTAFCEGLKTRILPGEVPVIVDQLMNLRKAPAVEFSEGGEKKSRSAVEDYQLQLKNRPETVQFGEFATGDRAGERQGEMDALALSRKAVEFQEAEGKAGRTITIADAVTHVQREATKGGAK
jgi:hypothetical protein